MSDLQLLFAVLLALYVWECVCWLPRGTVAVRSWLGRRWALLQGSTVLGNAKGGVVLAWPFPPLGLIHCASQLPISASPAGVAGLIPATGHPSLLPPQEGGWVELRDLADSRAHHRKVLCGGKLLVSAPSTSWALRLADLLTTWKKLPAENISTELRQFIRATLDTKTIETQRIETRRDVQKLQALANVLFAFLFVVCPITVWTFGLKSSWPWLLASLLALTICTSLSFRQAHARKFPNLSDDRFTLCLTIMLSPANAARAHDLFTRPLLEMYHPLALAKCFCSAAVFQTLARETWRDLCYPAGEDQNTPSPAVQAQKHTRAILREEVQAFLAAHGINADALLAAPTTNDQAAIAYCPRCLAQFVSAEASCRDCRGIQVLPLPTGKHAPPAVTR